MLHGYLCLSINIYKKWDPIDCKRVWQDTFLIPSLLIDMIDGYQNNKGHPRRLSLGDERTLRTLHKLQKELFLFTPK